MSLSKMEKETIITFNEQESSAEIYTYNQAMKSRLNGLCKKHPDDFTYLYDRDGASVFRFAKNLISIRAPRAGKKMSGREKEELVKRLQRGKKAQNPGGFTRTKKRENTKGKG